MERNERIANRKRRTKKKKTEQEKKMNIPVPVGEEVGPKLVRLLYFVGAGFLCTAAINKWRDLERKAVLQKQQGEKSDQLLENSSSN